MALDSELDCSMEDAIELIKDQLQHRSRASSPSQNAQNRAWYSAPPQLAVYDDDMIDVLLNIATKHISPTFTLFANFSAGPDTLVEQCLAMAAIGGLYCCSGTPNKTKVAKMLYNDSRRLLLENYLQNKAGLPLSFDDALSFAATFVLLEIYGFLSGDRRVYEFIEVFHGSKLHAAVSCIEAALPPGHADNITATAQQQQVRLLSEAIRILDSYRVMFLHRPPSFESQLYPLGHHGNDQEGHRHLSSGAVVSSPSYGNSMDNADGMHHLATIIRYNWVASPRDINNATSSSPLWRTEFVQLALDRWLRSKIEAGGPETCPDLSTPPNVAQMLLYHIAQVTLCSNMAILERVVVQAEADEKNEKNENNADKQGDGDGGNMASDNRSLGPWASKHQYEIALWHAKAILRIALDRVAPSCRQAGPTASVGGTAPCVEPPHVALCVYFATLIVWFGETRKLLTTRRSDPVETVTTDTGMQLLSAFHVPVSAILGKSLGGLLAGSGAH